MRIMYTWLLLLERPKLVQQVPSGYRFQQNWRHVLWHMSALPRRVLVVFGSQQLHTVHGRIDFDL